MKSSVILFLALTAQLVVCSVGFGQKQLKTEVQLGLSHALSYGGVAQDLGLTFEQKEKLHGLWSEVQFKLEQAFQSYKQNYSPRFSEEELQEINAELATKVEEIREGEMSRLEEALSSQQLSRLKQIRFQLLKRNSDGVKSLGEELSLTDGQISQLKDFKGKLKATHAEFLKYAREQQLTQNEILEEVAALREQNRGELLEILTASQRAKLAQLEGEPFEVQIGPPKEKDEDDK